MLLIERCDGSVNICIFESEVRNQLPDDQCFEDCLNEGKGGLADGVLTPDS